MSTPPERGPLALPTTWGGIAALAQGPLRRLAAWQLIIAVSASALIVWSLDLTWGTILQRAIQALPEAAEIRDGRLAWPDAEVRMLEEDPFLSVVVDPQGRRDVSLASDLNLVLERDRLVVGSVLGWLGVYYPDELRLPLGRLSMASLFATWRLPAMFLIGVGTAAGLLVSWFGLATVYAPFVWILARLFQRPLSLGRSGCLAAAALLPAAVLMTVIVVLYAVRSVGIFAVLLAVPFHLILGWIYLAGAVPRLRPRPRLAPTLPAEPAENPFGPEPEPAAEPPGEGQLDPTSPFRPRRTAPADRPPANPFQSSE